MEIFNWTPTPNQELLLKSALLESRQALRCWEQWQKSNDIEKVDRGSYRLLPMVFANLKQLIPTEDGWHNKLRGTYKKSWFSNTMLLATAARLFSGLKRMGIHPFLLKGIHLINAYYDDLASRPLGDADFLVAWEQAARVDEHMRSSGWRLKEKPRLPGFGESSMSSRNGINYINENGQGCDLHWNIMAHRCYPGADRDMLANAVPVAIQGDTVSALRPEGLLLHLLEHGAYGNPIPTIRWVPDVLMVLKKEDNMDWDRFLAHTLQTNLEVPVKAMLEYLLHTFNAEKVAYPLKRIARCPESQAGKTLYRNMLSRKTQFGISINEYRKLYDRFRLFMTEYKKESPPRGMAGLTRWLKFRWNVKSNILLPLVLTAKFFYNLVPYFWTHSGPRQDH